MKYSIVFLSLLLVACGAPSDSSDQSTDHSDSTAVELEQSARKGVFFKNLADLDTLTSPFVVEMGIEGMQVEPKGPIREGFGHHHLVIDGSFVEQGVFMPATENLIHYGNGQTVDTVSLAPGKHYLTLQFGDGMHNSYGFDWSSSITVYVK